MKVGDNIDYIKLCRNDGICFGPYGGKTTEAPDACHRLQRNRSVIRAFAGKDGRVMDRLLAYYDMDRLYQIVKQGDFTYRVKQIVPDSREGTSTDSSCTIINDSSSLLPGVEKELTMKDIDTETTTVSSIRQIKVSGGLSFEISVPRLDASLGIGASYLRSTTTATSNTFVYTQEITYRLKTTTSDVEPGKSITLTMSTERLQYEVDFSGPVECYYAHDSGRAIQGIFTGTISGRKVYNATIQQTDRTISPPTVAPVERCFLLCIIFRALLAVVSLIFGPFV